MDDRQILAKRPLDEIHVSEGETLLGHSRKTAEVFRFMFVTDDHPSRLCAKWLQFFKVADSCEEFLRTMPVICFFHDIGKANAGFQDAVRGKTGCQVIRHEHLSGLLLAMPEIRRLMEQAGLNVHLVVASIIGHHLKADHDHFGDPAGHDLKSFRVFARHTGELLGLILRGFGVQDSALLAIPEVWSFDGNVGFDATGLISQTRRDLHRFRHRLREDTSQRRLLLATRSALIVADSAASGLVRQGKSIREWIKTGFDESQLLNDEAIQNKVISPRIVEIERKRGSFQWRGFQEAAGNLPERALMVSSCGSGKTLAAWKWIASRARQRPVARVIFLYPTRGTATEGFRDYVSWAPEAEAALLHGTSAFELDGMFEDPKDQRYGKDFTTEDRLFALGYWQRRIFSATVDQFLGFMQNVYRSMCLMPLLVDSVIVFDEVHSFDRSLFSALRRFLQAFDMPVLCMTASLTARRRQDLNECGLKVFPESNALFADLQRDADMPRYHVQGIRDEKSALEIAMSGVREGKRVLWVVNTVPRCQRLAARLNSACYHSRFRLEDRKVKHDQVIAAYRPGKGGYLSVTTQVCEMSLDLDADVLITEAAPITSLIQRMGRCNRHAHPGQDRVGEVCFYVPEEGRPYGPEEMTGTAGFLKAIEGVTVSQSRLQELLEEFGPKEVEVEKYAAFLESGPWAVAREESLRDENEFTFQAILDTDVERYFHLKQESKPTDGLVVPVPRRFARRDMRVRGYWIADGANYSPDYGFLGHALEAPNE